MWKSAFSVGLVGEPEPDLDRVLASRLSQRDQVLGGVLRVAGPWVATVCNGTVVLRDDELTDEYPGRVLRSQTA